MLCRPLRPPLDASTDRGGRAVEDADAVALDELPPDALVRVVGCALPHHRGCSVAERAVDDVGVTRHPADVCGAPVDVAPGLQVEDVTVRGGHAGQIAAGRVQDALRLGGRARGVEDVQGVLSVQGLSGTLGVGLGEDLVVVDVAPGLYLAGGPLAAHDDDLLEPGEPAHHLIDAILHRRGLALARSAVDGDQQLCLRELHALAHGLGGEAPEDHVVRRADARAREHRDDHLGDHRQVDANHVALGYPLCLQRARQTLHLGEQLGVGDVALLSLLAAPVKRDSITNTGLDVAIEAVVGGVQRSTHEPFIEGRV